LKEGDTFLDDLPMLDPIIRHDPTEYGWRGLTAGGEVFYVGSANGHKAIVPDGDILVRVGDKAVGRRTITNTCPISVGEYLEHHENAVRLLRANKPAEALTEIDWVIGNAMNVRARMNRAMILLSLGRWNEGFKEFYECEAGPPFQRPLCRSALVAGLRPWRGESISGNHLMLLHDHGYGDTIMMLRYIVHLQKLGAKVSVVAPDDIGSLIYQVARVTPKIEKADYFCTMLDLGHILKITPENVLSNFPLVVDLDKSAIWHDRLGVVDKPLKIGIAWSVRTPSLVDYQREIPLKLLVDALSPYGYLYSVQKQGSQEAKELGVVVNEFGDFADCSALMSQLDWIVSADTAALHLAGAIEHPRVTGLLSHWHSWRWLANWYPNIRFCRQTSEGDWASAVGQLLS
jgi:hypothetical protein